FYACYLLAGITDMVDGSVARGLETESEFGEKLDTIADFIFVLAALYKLLPAIALATGIWIWTGIIAVVKVINIISGFVVQKRFVAVHSLANKITGIALFLLPLTLPFVDIKYTAVLVCILATFAAVQEGHFIRSMIRYEYH
ncbi:MAG: CDP-alcohol phosphatidyltransferase family protein, partial [Lachnospiraceae bacterium]|nr:CDP-alcohol phosphatidyltransferase family protein [Lachnospiraceae bacterium]